MSDGLRYLRKVIDEDNRSALFQTSESDYIAGEIANEVAVYDYLLSHSTEHGSLPSVDTVRQETGVRLPEANDALSYYLTKIIERKIYNEARDINQDFRSDMASKDVSNLYSIGRRFMTIANDQRISNSSMCDSPSVASSINTACNMARLDSVVIPTGFPRLDVAMMGGFSLSDFIFVVARPDSGKTTVMMRSAKAAYEASRRILIISMEMPMDDMSMLFMAHMAGINPKFVNPYGLGTYEALRMGRTQEQITDEDRVFVHKGGSGMTPNKVRWLIESLAPDIVYIDSLYLMAPDGKYVNRLDRYSRIALTIDQILELNVDMRVPIYCTSQFNRQAGKGAADGSLENIGYSDNVATHAKLIIALKHVHLGESTTDVDRSKIELDVLKSKKGQVDPFAINYIFSPMDFTEVDPINTAEDSDNDADLIEALNNG